MIRSVYTKSMWDQRHGLLGWGSAFLTLILVESAMWPSMRDMPSLDTYVDELPSGLRDLFALDTMTTGQGFLNAELFTLVLPLSFIAYGVVRGARMLAGEEQAGTLDLLLVTPLSTTRLLLEKALALITGLTLLALVVVLATISGSLLFGLGLTLSESAQGALALLLIGTEFGILALVAGALTGRRAVALGMSSGAATGAYLLFVAGSFIEQMRAFRPVSPFEQALHAGPLGGGVPVSYVWLILLPAVLLALAWPMWSRRDIGTH